MRLIDVTPTLLALLGLDGIPDAEGRSLLPLLHEQRLSPLPAITEFGARARVTGSRYALIVRPRGTALFDREVDPGENVPLDDSRPDELAAMRAILDDHENRPRRAAAEATVPLSPDTVEAMKALGYL